ncbi:hypothetical protein DL96DRAFT_1821160 [Flagelloscypha sp. PMI_526]|nr:hypothetical protein DL96DRAFT_1821160 [Flagelloscypha sp. PMI_526]
MPNNRQFPKSSRGYSRCCGVLEDWSQCDIEAWCGNACWDHVGQILYLNATYLSASERVDHAEQSLCSGFAKTKGRLCNNRKAPFTFCHHHVDQEPPTWKRPSSLPHSKDPQHIQLRNMLLDLVYGARGRRNPFRKRARQEEEEKCRCQKEAKARRRREEEDRQRRQWEEEDRQRRQREEQDRQRRQQEEQDRQRRQQEEQNGQHYQWEEDRQRGYREEQPRQNRQQEQRSSRSGHRYFMRVNPPASIYTAHAEYIQRCDALKASLRRPNPNRLYTFADVPWPTRILKPTVDNVTPDKVRDFFEALGRGISLQTKKEVLADAQKFFRPRRFLARGVYTKLRWADGDEEAVKLKVEEVSRTLNVLMGIINEDPA